MKKTLPKIEIEFRAILNKTQYKKIEMFLKNKAKSLGKDDKDVYFFTMPDKLLKVVNNISKKSAAIVIKLNEIGKGSDFEEIEIPILQRNIKKAVKIFTMLGISDNIMHDFQKRHNYLYKGVELALKYSDVWGYHLELEIMVDNKDKKEIAENKIRKIADELNIRLMTEKELAEFIRKAKEKYKNKK